MIWPQSDLEKLGAWKGVLGISFLSTTPIREMLHG